MIENSFEKRTELKAERDRAYTNLLREHLRLGDAAQEGRSAALNGKGYGECPYPTGEGLEPLTEAVAWRAGFQAGEIEQAEGAHFRTK